MMQQLTTQEHLARALVISLGAYTDARDKNQFYHNQIMKVMNYVQRMHRTKSQVKYFIELIEEITSSMPEESINKPKINLVVEAIIEHLGKND